MTARLQMLAQRLELLDRFARWRQRSTFQAGDLVVEKPGLGEMPDGLDATHALMFWRYLSPDDQAFDAALLARAALSRNDAPDCLLGILSDCGRTVTLLPWNSAGLLPLFQPEAELLDRIARLSADAEATL